MSFNPNDNNLSPISRSNYEEYFLLYADNELSTAERDSLQQFLIAHPDLQPELDLLLSTRLPMEEIRLDHKESLLAHSMQLNNVDEALLLYIDNELAGKEKRTVEEKLKTDNAYLLQYESLLKTKPATLDKIVCPDKKGLYHYEEKRRFSLYWVRVAAAAVIVLGMGVFVFTYQQKADVPVADVPTKTQPVEKTDGVLPGKTDVAIKTGVETPVKTTVIKVGETDDVPNVVRHLKKKVEQREINKEPIVPSIETKEENENVAISELKKEQKNIVVDRQEVPQQQTINNRDVTTRSPVAFNNQTASPSTAEQRDVVKTENEKKSSVKGFLRKATRFIERTTNITTTNEDNELIVGAVALKL